MVKGGNSSAVTSALTFLIVELFISESVMSHSALLQLKTKSCFWITCCVGQNESRYLGDGGEYLSFKTLLAARLLSMHKSHLYGLFCLLAITGCGVCDAFICTSAEGK